MIHVEAFDSLARDAWGPIIAELNLSSRRPSPFHTLEYFETYLAHDEFATPETRPRFLVAYDDERPIGVLALKHRTERLLGIRCARLELLTTHDADRPTIIARAEDEARCAEAFSRHLFDEARDWTMLELWEQDEHSPLHSPRADERRFHVRHFPTNPNATVELRGGFEAWFRSLRNFRSNLARRTRSLLGAGHVELLSCDDRAAARPMLDLYLDLESRSWKAETRAGIGRHPTRVAKFHALLAPHQPWRPVVHWILLDGVPIAGMLSLLYANTAYQMELAFDRAYASLSPGNVLFMLAIRDLVARGAGAYNLLGNFAYHKARWNAVVTETSSVQIYRRGSLHHKKAIAGDLRRRLASAKPGQDEVDFNLTKPEEKGDDAPRVDRSEARERAYVVLRALEHSGARIERLHGDALKAVLPFRADAHA